MSDSNNNNHAEAVVHGYITRDELINKLFDEMDDEELVNTNSSDNINNPQHYNQGAVETIDYIIQVSDGYDSDVSYCIGNTIKYISRAPFKGKELEDLHKALWYLNKAISLYKLKSTTHVR